MRAHTLVDNPQRIRCKVHGCGKDEHLAPEVLWRNSRGYQVKSSGFLFQARCGNLGALALQAHSLCAPMDRLASVLALHDVASREPLRGPVDPKGINEVESIAHIAVVGYSCTIFRMSLRHISLG